MDNDPTKLTSFSPLSPVVSSSGFSLSTLFDFRKKATRSGKFPPTAESYRKTSQDSGRNSEASAQSSSDSATPKPESHGNKDNLYSWLTESVSSQTKLYGGKEKVPEVRLTQSDKQVVRKDKWKYRNVKTILRRLSALTIDRRWHQSTGDFKHNFKQYWMPDEHCKECYECGAKFNTFRRRHHCRVCGQIFCYKCCSEEVPGKVIGFSGDIRVCNYCFKIVQAYLSDDLEKSIETLSQDITAFDSAQPYELGGSSSSVNSAKNSLLLDDSGHRIRKSASSNSLVNAGTIERSPTPIQKSPFDAFGVAPSEAITIKQDYLRDLWRQITDPKKGLELSSHRYHMKTYHNCLVANELNDWLIKFNRVSSRDEAVVNGQALLDNGWIEPVYQTHENVFKDEYLLFQPTKAALLETELTALNVTLNSINSDDEVDDSDDRNTNVKGVEEEEEDYDEEMPNWLKQLSNVKVPDDTEIEPALAQLSNNSRRFSAGRHLDLDHVTNEDSDGKKADLSIQIDLDSRPDDVNKEDVDPKIPSKISFITHVPPPSLDTYVCVEGHQTAVKKKMTKPNSQSNLAEDILRGVVFPRPYIEPVVPGEDENLDDASKDETGERLAKERVSIATIHHLRSLLAQLLKQDNLLPLWDEIILPFIAKISSMVVPDVRRDDDMDIRRYVWITKVPGGLKKDCHLINGVVFRKNVSHKRMNMQFFQPRILMMSCAIEYQRNENKITSLDPLVLQEQAFLQNFVKRVLALKPNILLVEKSVARVAQEMFLAGGVTLVHNIKPQIMENIARCTGSDILQTMEQVTRPRLGTCQQFRLHKYEIPKTNDTKTLMYFDGCAPDLGCSLVLRGGNEKTLLKIKKIIKYLIYVAYHLKLEEKFLMDEFAMPPSLNLLTPQCQLQSEANNFDRRSISLDESELGSEFKDKEMVAVPDMHEESETEKFEEALKMIILSSSPFCNYSMPYLLTDHGKSCPSRHFIAQKIYWSRYLDGSVNQPMKLIEDDHEWVENQSLSPNVIMVDPHPFTDPSILLDCMEDEDKKLTVLRDFRARGGRIDLKMFHEYEEMQSRKIFGEYYDIFHNKGKDEVDGGIFDGAEIVNLPPAIEHVPDPKHDCFDAYNHQKIAVLFSSYSSESHNAPKPCISPWAVFMEFYGRNDITLGGFLERYCFRPSYICPSHNCDVPMVNHVRYFAHGNGSLYIHMRKLESPIPGYDRTILTWSWCKMCKQVTPVVPLSFECWSMSFAKYLELRFYGGKYTRRASAEPCGHSLHHDHYQYFSYANMVASFKYCPIDSYEVILPRNQILIGKQGNPNKILDEVEDIYVKVESVTSAIMDRMNQLKTEDYLYTSTTRETQLNDFMTDLKREQKNLQDCVQVIKIKASEVVTPKVSEEDEGNKSIVSGSHSTDTRESRADNLKSNSSVSIGIQMPAVLNKNVTDENPMEVVEDNTFALMVDIGNKIFHLKKSMCELVENWNVNLQEFIAQDKKREKVARPTSPAKFTVPTPEMAEFYPDGSSELDPTQPKTVTHMHPEPVSEVFLTDGTILRQTYFGTKPTVTGEPVSDSLAVARKSSNSVPVVRKTSESIPTSAKERKDLSLDLDLDEDKKFDNAGDNIRSKVGSPYMVIQSPTKDETKKDENAAKEKDCSLVVEKTTDVAGQSDSTTSNLQVEQWMSKSKVDQAETNIDVSDSEASLKVECNSDQELSDNQSMFTEDDADSNLPESEVQSEVEVAEEENDDVEDVILVGESAVDFVERKQHAHATPKVPKTKTTQPSTKLKLPGYTEFPKMKEEKLEKIEYLTPKEAKAIQNARRRRNEWESRIKKSSVKDTEPKKKVASHVPLVFKSNHYSQVKKPVESVGQQKRSVSPASNVQSKGQGTKSQTSKSQPAKLQLAKTQPAKSKSVPNLKPRKSNPLIKRLVQNTFDATDGKSSKKSKTTPVKKVTTSGKVSTKSGKFKPIKSENITDGNHPLKANENTDAEVSTSTEKSESTVVESTPVAQEKPVPMSNYQRRKMMGHRRMKSAPLSVTKTVDTTAPSDLTPESPFVFLNPEEDEVRLRSRSVGNRSFRGRKELSRMAELVCNEDRIAAERDVPEVLQYESNREKNPDGTGIIQEGITKPAQNDRKVSDDSGLVLKKPQKLGHMRQMSLQLRFLNSTYDLDGTDGKLFTVGEVSVSNKRGGSEKMKKIISQFLPSTNFQPIPRPFPSSEQYMNQMYGSSFITINEKEPTSLIAFTLSSQEYRSQLQVIQDLMAGKSVSSQLLQPQNPLHSQPNTPSPTRKHVSNSSLRNSPIPPSDKLPEVVYRSHVTQSNPRPRSWAGTTASSGLDEADFKTESQNENNQDSPSLRRINGVGRHHPLSSIQLDHIADGVPDIDDMPLCDDALDGSGSMKSGGEDTKKSAEKPPIDYHIRLPFQNNVAKFYCSVYYAEQFRQLRELIFPEGEERFIQSLRRCMFWKATGGKSGSSFSKSLDDRFVMKQMSRPEIQSFVDFAPRYFSYIRKTIKEKWPSAMAKLLGVYRIGFKNSVTNTTMRQDVLVMENLLYEKKVNKIFDLKGSVRNRYMPSKHDVLMDENLLEMICESPLFIRPHSKAVLSKAIYNDTEFLSTNMVMDYSLLVGIDETKNELVVGIIDYIRTYTWDKKLETWVKVLGGQGKMPTVVSPEVYRTRFTEAMQRYFLMVPDKWTGFGADLN